MHNVSPALEFLNATGLSADKFERWSDYTITTYHGWLVSCSIERPSHARSRGAKDCADAQGKHPYTVVDARSLSGRSDLRNQTALEGQYMVM